MMVALKIGVLAVQGAFYEHIQALNKVYRQIKVNQTHYVEMEILEVRCANDLSDSMDGLIIPGKTVISVIMPSTIITVILSD